jgi:hypothetical protein
MDAMLDAFIRAPAFWQEQCPCLASFVAGSEINFAYDRLVGTEFHPLSKALHPGNHPGRHRLKPLRMRFDVRF